MAEEKEKEKDPKESGAITMGGLRTLVGEVVKELLPVGNDKEDKDKDKDKSGDAPTTSVKTMVQAELDKIRAREARDQRDKNVDDQLAKLAPLTEQKTPVERGRLHRFMGWGDND